MYMSPFDKMSLLLLNELFIVCPLYTDIQTKLSLFVTCFFMFMIIMYIEDRLNTRLVDELL